MAEIINLNRYKKALARKTKETAADAKRARFGRTKREKTAQDDAARRKKKHLDDHKREAAPRTRSEQEKTDVDAPSGHPPSSPNGKTPDDCA